MTDRFYTKFILLFLLTFGATAQKEWSVYGKILNAETQEPISAITVTNQRNKHVVVTNKSGNFYIRAAEKDSLVVSGIAFGSTTVYWDKKVGNMVIGLKQQAIALAEVVITDKRLETIEREIKAFLDNPHNATTMKRDIMGNMINASAASGLGGGAGLSIDALYDLFSKEGKAKRKAAELEYQDVRKYYIELRYNKGKVAAITGLQNIDLDEFMNYCRLTDSFILNASDYDLTYQIFTCLREFNNSAQIPLLKK